MTLTGMQLLTCNNALSVLGQQDIPILVAHKIALLIRALKAEVATIDELRVKLLEKYAKKDDNGRLMTKDNGYVLEDAEKFNDEFRLLLDKQFDLELRPLRLSELGTDFKFSPVLLLALLDAGIVIKD